VVILSNKKSAWNRFIAEDVRKALIEKEMARKAGESYENHQDHSDTGVTQQS
jgi:hypothetical protein